jgi:hypothetical protein
MQKAQPRISGDLARRVQSFAGRIQSAVKTLRFEALQKGALRIAETQPGLVARKQVRQDAAAIVEIPRSSGATNRFTSDPPQTA